MRVPILFRHNRLGHLALTAALSGAVLFFAASPARADVFHQCQEKLDRAQTNINHDISHHGPNSWQVRRDYGQLENARGWCGAHGANRDGRRYERDDRYRDGFRGNDGYYDRGNGYDR